jgi:nitric oxide reductase activation protein
VATAHLRAQKPTRKILIVLTDGDTEARQCNSSIDKAIDCGINVIGVALKDDAKLNRTMKNAHKIRATTPESVARELSLITRKILRKK